MRLNFRWLLALGYAINADAAGNLVVEHAWIRAAPPGAMMLAGYATLRNTGDLPVTVTGADSADFADVSLHESVEENGIDRMRALGNIEIAPGATVQFAPGGKHFMLMRPKRDFKEGDTVKIHINIRSGVAENAQFIVRDTAP
jgi:copper(I)-binding protein